MGAGLSSAIALAPSIYAFAKSFKQERDAKKLGNRSRPEMKVPDAITDNYRNAKFQYGNASKDMFEAGRDSLDENFSEQQGAIGQAATDSSGLLAALTAANTSRNRANVDINNNIIAQKTQDLNTLMQSGSEYSKWQNEAWDWNKKQPYVDAMIASSALRKSAEMNRYNALNSVANVGLSSLMNKDDGTPDATTTTATDGTDLQTANATPEAIAAQSYRPVNPQVGYDPMDTSPEAKARRQQVINSMLGIK